MDALRYPFLACRFHPKDFLLKGKIQNILQTFYQYASGKTNAEPGAVIDI